MLSDNTDISPSDKMHDPVCGLSHRFRAAQCEMFDQDHGYLCCDSRDCPFKLVRKRIKYCLFEEVRSAGSKRNE